MPFWAAFDDSTQYFCFSGKDYLFHLWLATISISLLTLVICGTCAGVQMKQLGVSLNKGLTNLMTKYTTGKIEKVRSIYLT